MTNLAKNVSPAEITRGSISRRRAPPDRIDDRRCEQVGGSPPTIRISAAVGWTVPPRRRMRSCVPIVPGPSCRKSLTFRSSRERLLFVTTRSSSLHPEMALRRPTVRSRSAPRNHFGFFFSSRLKSRFWERLGNDWRLRGIEEAAHHDASRPPASTASARFCCAPATASRFA